MEIGISVFMIIGIIFIVVGSVGVLRFPDVYTRLHSCGLISTLGVGSLALSCFIFFLKDGAISIKALIFLIFTILTTPVSTHLIGRASLKSVPLWEKSTANELERDVMDN